MADNHDEAITQFTSLTGASADIATQYLTATSWNLETAAAAFFADAEEGDPTSSAQPGGAAGASSEPEYTGPRTLDGRPAPQAAAGTSSATSRSSQPKKKGIATLGSLGGHGAAHDHHHDDDDDDDDDEEEGHRGDLFAGGEKSGLAVQDPSAEPAGAKKIINDIVKKARANATRPESEAPRSNQFRGSGQTLGGDGVASRTIPDPFTHAGIPQPPASEEPQSRTLHLWRDGFSIDDGPNHRFDDPQNAADLALIREGRAPLHLMNVRYDQPVDVKLEQHDENWRQLPRIYKPFGGVGRRLGSPLPGDGSSTEAVPSIAATTAASVPATSASDPAGPVTIDESQPTLTIRVQLPNGTRLPARFNATHTVGDVYEVVKRASPETGTRTWVLATTFPNKDHTDHSLALGDMAEFKRGGTAVVKWV